MIESAFRFIREIVGWTRKEAVPGPDRLIPCEPRLSFVLPINGVWASVADHSATPSRLLEHYLDPDTPKEEVLAAAILVYAGDRPWNTTEHSECFMHVAWWLSAITELLDGETSVFIWAWEESGMQAVRRDELVILEERTHHIPYQLPPVCFQLGAFARQLVHTTQVARQLVTGLKQVAQELYPNEWRSALDSVEAVRAHTSDPSLALQVNHEKALAEFETFERRALKKAMLPDYQPPPPPTTTEVRATRLKEVLDYLAGEDFIASWEKLSAKVRFEP
jgi:hypothetical protein